MKHLTWIEISKSALIHNARAFKRVLGHSQLMGVVKSNAYGHGVFEVSRTIAPYVHSFGVASGTEALELRAFGIKKPILVLNYYGINQIKDLVQKNVTLVVYSLDQVRAIARAAKSLKTTAKIHVKVGTGLSRLGIYARDALSLIKKICTYSRVEIEGLFSHFASSEDDPGFTMVQLNHFNNIIKDLEKANINIPIKHISCTASCLGFPESHFDLSRVGIGIYGLESYRSIHSLIRKANPKFSIKPVMTWRSTVLAVKDLPVGAYVGYGRTYKTTKKTRLAILSVGYNEGYDRKLSNLAEVLIQGKRCKVRGRVYMNLVGVDVTNVKNVKVGSEAVLLGKQKLDEIPADELAQIAGTINYEIVTRINPTLPRVLVK
jgi:alanine racemase